MTVDDRIKQYLAFMPEEAQISVETLNALGFFTAPASVKYHGNYEGGLFDHSFAVAETLVNLTDKLGLTWRRSRSPFLVGMYHDLCKCDNYVLDGSGNWSYSDDVLNPDHGSKSALIASRYFDLTTEEELCIRWHMGAYETDTKLWNYYGRAIERFPNVLFTHTADMIASRIIGV